MARHFTNDGCAMCQKMCQPNLLRVRLTACFSDVERSCCGARAELGQAHLRQDLAHRLSHVCARHAPKLTARVGRRTVVPTERGVRPFGTPAAFLPFRSYLYEASMIDSTTETNGNRGAFKVQEQQQCGS